MPYHDDVSGRLNERKQLEILSNLISKLDGSIWREIKNKNK